MSTKTTRKSVKKALGILKSLQDQMSTKNKEASLEDVLAAVQKEEAALGRKREKVQKRQEKVNAMVATLKKNRKEKKLKVKDKLQDMVPAFNKLYDTNNRPVVTICSVKKGNKIYEGWAVCSDIENPRHKKGENIALKRAAEVLITSKPSLPVNRVDAKEILDCLNVWPHAGYKATFYGV